MKKIMNSPIGIALIVGVISVIIACVTTEDLNQFLDTLRGVSYEGFAFACILAIVIHLHEKNKEKETKQSILKEKKKSRDSLIKMISLLCEAYTKGGVFHWTKHVNYADTFENNFSEFQTARVTRKDNLEAQLKDKFFRNSCEQNLPIFTSYIPIAEKLSPAHLDAWVGLTTVVSLTASKGLDPNTILDEFQNFVLEFTREKIEV